MINMKEIILKLENERFLSDCEFRRLIEDDSEETARFLTERADAVKRRVFSNKVYIRGLVEFTNYCKNNCLYCGIRRENQNAQRYRLNKEEILDCCAQGYSLGFRTFVLQGGEDSYFTDERMADIISSIKSEYPDCAVTLSLGERSRKSYEIMFRAGADRYLLRHETADAGHYGRLHPPELSLENRKKCLYELKEIGYQVGCGFMVGSPYQNTDCIIEDLKFIRELKPHMVGIGPFIPHKDTPFRNMPGGGLELTLKLISILRLMDPNLLLPSTTALGTIDIAGREKGILAGANVVMPNLSPKTVRKKYTLYDNKICTGEEAAECIICLKRRLAGIGHEIVVSRGDHIGFREDI